MPHRTNRDEHQQHQMMMTYREPAFLRGHISDVINFYYPRCLDETHGGYLNEMNDDEPVSTSGLKHLVNHCRLVYNFCVAYAELQDESFKRAAMHGLKYLLTHFKQPDGGYAWTIKDEIVQDGTRHAYGHAFVLLAAAMARKTNIPSSGDLVFEVFSLLEKRFWSAKHQLYVDEISAQSWSQISPYRGQNANMHMCEALISAYEATNDTDFLKRALLVAKRICVDLTKDSNGLIWEHYHEDWTHDFDFNKNSPKTNFLRPYGVLSGHLIEWSKLLLILDRHCASDQNSTWLLPTAQRLFDSALSIAGDTRNGGLNYSFLLDNTIIDSDRYFWVFAEAIATSALLALRTRDNQYWQRYDKFWHFAKTYLIKRTGEWHRVLNSLNNPYSDSVQRADVIKVDYHPIAACYEILRAYAALDGDMPSFCSHAVVMHM